MTISNLVQTNTTPDLVLKIVLHGKNLEF